MSEDEFTKLFKYVEAFRSEMNQKFEQTASRSSMDKLTNTIDGFIGRIDKYETELAARDAQFQRLLVWARKVSKKTGIPLESL
ncbi:MAG: hypothetical protein V4702_04175 [Patescibacteria group bacterium]